MEHLSMYTGNLKCELQKHKLLEAPCIRIKIEFLHVKLFSISSSERPVPIPGLQISYEILKKYKRKLISDIQI